jgi:hypothetical protein
MKARFVYALMLVVALCALAASTVLADAPVVFYDDTEADRDFPHVAGGPSYVRNGAFDDWAELDGMPIDWKQDVSSITGAGHWAKMDFANPDSEEPNYALGLFLKNEGTNAAGSAIAYSELQISAEGDYWVVVHSTAWGENVGPGGVAWYAIYPTEDPAAVPASEWRELGWYPCPNQGEICNYLGREELRHIKPGSYLFLKGAVKYPTMHGWTVFGWDDIGIWDLVAGDVWPHDDLGLLDDGDVTWDQHAIR